jgi:carboxymethylenebutenolidase
MIVKIIKRILLAALGMLAVLILILVGSVAVDAALGVGRMAALTNTVIPGQDGRPDVRAFVARPAGTSGPLPVVIMIHEFYGLNESIVSRANGLAEEGYLVIAPDTFRGATTAWIPRAIFQVITTPSEQVNHDPDAVFAWAAGQAKADPARVAILGFCYGGRTSLAYSLHNHRLAATVIFYGAPETDPEVLKALPGPVLGIFGGADQSIPREEVKAFEAGLEQAGVLNQVSIYEDQPHAFVQDMAGIRAGGAQGQAWAEMLAFLQAHLKPAGGSSSGVSRSGAPGLAYHDRFHWGYYARLVYEHAFGGARHMH